MTAETALPKVDPQQIGERIQSLIKQLPADIWNTTTPPTWFKISNNVASLVPSNYQPKSGELLFVYKNDDGFISIQQKFPAQKGA